MKTHFHFSTGQGEWVQGYITIKRGRARHGAAGWQKGRAKILSHTQSWVLWNVGQNKTQHVVMAFTRGYLNHHMPPCDLSERAFSQYGHTPIRTAISGEEMGMAFSLAAGPPLSLLPFCWQAKIVTNLYQSWAWEGRRERVSTWGKLSKAESNSWERDAIHPSAFSKYFNHF